MSKIDWAQYLQEQQDRSSGEYGTKEEKDEHFTLAEASLLEKVIRKGLVESKEDLEVQKKDPLSPLFAIKSFEVLCVNPNLMKGVYAMGYHVPSKIQELALPALLADPPKNLIAQSQSGTGKTATFILAILGRVDPRKNYTQVLCLSPTYELAVQTGEVATKMAQFCPDVKMKYCVSGEHVDRNTTITEHIIFGTPGKVLDWALKYRYFDLFKISVFVLDEADVMIDSQGHQDQCIRIHKRLNRKCQMMFFSSTYNDEVMDFAEVIVPNPLIIRVKREQQCLTNIKQYYVRCANADEKYAALTNIYGVLGIGQCIIFCHTRRRASWLAEKMFRDGHAVALLTGELLVEQRIAILDRFRFSLEKVLIATNVLSRGIDVMQVTIVVNFDLPINSKGEADCETYLHRIGRTGRFGRAGIAINFIDSPEAMTLCKAIETHFRHPIKYLDADDSDEIEKIGE